jgi:tRNA pseudouridine38/39 synthase
MSRSRKWRSPESAAARHEARAASSARKMESKTDYSAWSQESLIERVTQLEQELSAKNRRSLLPIFSLKQPLMKSSLSPPAKKKYKRPRVEKPFDPSKYNTRLIALKLAYLGKKYNGYEHHVNNATPLPTIEEELWKALNKARLIFPTAIEGFKEGEVNWEGTDYSKCGRTDKGVSAFGQVIGIRVRSNRPLVRKKEIENEEVQVNGEGVPSKAAAESTELQAMAAEPEEEPPFDSIADELPYASLLNKILPPDIRILAWCPNPGPDFSARFSCRERRYR